MGSEFSVPKELRSLQLAATLTEIGDILAQDTEALRHGDAVLEGVQELTGRYAQYTLDEAVLIAARGHDLSKAFPGFVNTAERERRIQIARLDASTIADITRKHFCDTEYGVHISERVFFLAANHELLGGEVEDPEGGLYLLQAADIIDCFRRKVSRLPGQFGAEGAARAIRTIYSLAPGIAMEDIDRVVYENPFLDNLLADLKKEYRNVRRYASAGEQTEAI
jgi:hypothetical protein